MHAVATLIERLWADGQAAAGRTRSSPSSRSISTNELDLMREAANASQLRRNFEGSPLLLVPEVYWDYCAEDVMVMQRMHGTPVNQVAALREQGVDIPRLARAGVEIFFTQVFRDGFFHADMHPGNILVSPQGRYIALDFGIMGTLTEIGQALPRAELPRLLPPRLPPRRGRAHRVGLGAARHAASTSSKRRSARCASRCSTGR